MTFGDCLIQHRRGMPHYTHREREACVFTFVSVHLWDMSFLFPCLQLSLFQCNYTMPLRRGFNHLFMCPQPWKNRGVPAPLESSFTCEQLNVWVKKLLVSLASCPLPLAVCKLLPAPLQAAQDRPLRPCFLRE